MYVPLSPTTAPSTWATWDGRRVDAAPEPRLGERRVIQIFGTDGRQTVEAPPLSEVPARVEEWNGEQWILLGTASTQEEIKHLFGSPRME